jgi:predicted MPP superfamily phosphohydrolase
MIRILHLTDFHLNAKTLTDWNDFYKVAFFLKLDELQQEKRIELVTFTGDLIDKGGISFKEKEDVLSPATKGFAIFKENIIEPILEKLNLDISRFIICPGNHDINRFADDEADEIGQKATLTTPDKIIEFIKKSDENDSFKRIERIKEYKIFEQDLYKEIDDNKLHSLFKFSVIANINGKKIGITSLNSSWRCYDDNDFGNILIGENQVNDNYKFIKDCDIKIGLMHHQLECLSQIEQKTIKNHLSNNFDLLLSGHVHNSNTEYIQSISKVFPEVVFIRYHRQD